MALLLYDVKFLLLIGASFITIFSSIAIYFCLPLLISHTIRQQISLSPNSASLEGWRLNSVYDYVYLYNITNIEEILTYIDNEQSTSKPPPNRIDRIDEQSAAKDRQSLKVIKPVIREVGPFVLKQEREKINLSWNSVNETVLYDQVQRWFILNEQDSEKVEFSKNHLLNTSTIYHLNVPLAGTTLTHIDLADAINSVVDENKLSLFMKHNASELLFDGYPDVLMEQAKATGQYNVDRFGYFHGKNNTARERIRVFTGPSNRTLNKFGYIDELSDSRIWSYWHKNNSEPHDTTGIECNMFRYSSAGEFFPPPEQSLISYNSYETPSDLNSSNSSNNSNNNNNYNYNFTNEQVYSGDVITKAKSSTTTASITKSLQGNKQEKKRISLLMPELCRKFELVHSYSYEYEGKLTVDRYIIDKLSFDYTNKIDNQCYCVYNDYTKLSHCPPNGLMSLYNCVKGSSMLVSLPNFMFSRDDPTLKPYLNSFDYDNVDGDTDHSSGSFEQQHDNDERLFFVDLEQTLNIPINVQIALQFNVNFKQEDHLNFTKQYRFLVENSPTKRDIYLPQMWIKSKAQVDPAYLKNLVFLQRHLIYVTPLTTSVLFVAASILLIASAKSAYDLTYGQKSRKSSSSQMCGSGGTGSSRMCADSFDMDNHSSSDTANGFFSTNCASGGGGGDGSSCETRQFKNLDYSSLNQTDESASALGGLKVKQNKNSKNSSFILLTGGCDSHKYEPVKLQDKQQ